MKLIKFFQWCLLLLAFTACGESTTEREHQETSDQLSNDPNRTATFAGGCFWCTEAYFERLRGVEKVVSGYSGGEEKNPSYRQVSTGLTGHAEAVQIHFNPDSITYQQLLEVFFATHDPTTLNRQGPDVGKQYRSVIFYHNSEQKQLAEQYLQQLKDKKVYRNKIVTELQPLKNFYQAEDYHQDYYRINPRDAYVLSVAQPKVKKFEKQYKEWLKPEYQK